jgi:hypothetical protein
MIIYLPDSERNTGNAICMVHHSPALGMRRVTFALAHSRKAQPAESWLISPPGKAAVQIGSEGARVPQVQLWRK